MDIWKEVVVHPAAFPQPLSGLGERQCFVGKTALPGCVCEFLFLLGWKKHFSIWKDCLRNCGAWWLRTHVLESQTT